MENVVDDFIKITSKNVKTYFKIYLFCLKMVTRWLTLIEKNKRMI